MRGESVRVTCAHSEHQSRQQARSKKDGLAVSNAVDAKHLRYPPSGGELIPIGFEIGGRPGEETISYVRSWGNGYDAGEKTEIIRYGWQQLSTLLQTGNADMVLSATG